MQDGNIISTSAEVTLPNNIYRNGPVHSAARTLQKRIFGEEEDHLSPGKEGQATPEKKTKFRAYFEKALFLKVSLFHNHFPSSAVIINVCTDFLSCIQVM